MENADSTSNQTSFLDLSKLKAFADDTSDASQMIQIPIQNFWRKENIVGKGEKYGKCLRGSKTL